jgi:flagellar export protein FliJ
LAARRKREMLEKLKEKEYAEYHRELLGKEQRELDDIAATRFMQREAPSS